MSRPSLRLIDGLREQADMSAAELTARSAEAHRHVAHLRLLAQQLPLWTPEEAQRMVLKVTEAYARKWAQPDDGRAA